MIRYYLGVAVAIDPDDYAEGTVDMAKPGWVWGTWPDRRRFRFWSEQLKIKPWEGNLHYEREER